jgi:3alpha(or 20beta)-hydroxysteroid dehydrogenase
VHHDVTSEEQWAGAVATTVDAFGRIDVLVNNAGVLTNATIAEMALADFRRVLDVNLVGCWLGVKAVIAPMTAAGGGSIVNISSIEGFAGAAGLSAYSAAKFGIRGVTRAAAQELGKFGIRVNSVHPGGVMTRMVMETAQSFTGVDPVQFVNSMPIPRFAEPVEISRLVAFLASDEASYSTGSEFVADGGILSGPGY